MISRFVSFSRAFPLSSCRLGRLRSSKNDELSSGKEKFIPISDIIKEAEELNEDLVFTDDNVEEPIFKHEHRIMAAPEEKASMPKIKNALDPSAADVTSAYAPEQGFKEVTVDVLKEKLEKNEYSLLLDVRGPVEYAAGHVPGARNIPLDELTKEFVEESDLKEYKDKPVAVICGIGKRSAQATVRLTKVIGFQDVTSVAAGTKEWIARGYEVDK